MFECGFCVEFWKWKSKPSENQVTRFKIFSFVLFCTHNRKMELQLLFPASFSNSYCSSSDDEFGSLEDENLDEELIESKSDSPRPSNISLFMSYRQFRDVLDLMDSCERLSPIFEEPELEYSMDSVDASSPLIVPHPSVRRPQHSAKGFHTGTAPRKEIGASNSTLQTLSGSSVIGKSSGTCCFVWLKTILKWKSRRTKKFE